MPREIDLKVASLLQILMVIAATVGLTAILAVGASELQNIAAHQAALRASTKSGLTAAALLHPRDSAWRRLYDSPHDAGRSKRIFAVTNFNHDAFERMAGVFAQILPTYNCGDRSRLNSTDILAMVLNWMKSGSCNQNIEMIFAVPDSTFHRLVA